MICKNCLALNTSNNKFIGDICSACLNFEKRKKIDWKSRKKIFLSLFKRDI